MRILLSIAVGGLLLATSITQSFGSPATPVGGPDTSLAAWNEYCLLNPAECHVDPSEPRSVSFTPRLMRLLRQVNLSVNSRIVQMPDAAHRGRVDVWETPSDGIGDCEDLQLLKRRMLVEAGLPRRALLMTVTLDPRGEGHAVLTVRTTEGDYILDNQNNDVLRWDRTTLVYLKRESQDAVSWVALGARPTSPVTAATSQ